MSLNQELRGGPVDRSKRYFADSMSDHSDRLERLRKEAQNAEGRLAALSTESWPAEDAGRTRVERAVVYADIVLGATDPELLSASSTEQIEQALLQVAGDSVDPAAAAANSQAWSDGLLDALARLPVAQGREIEQAIKDAAARFQRSAQQRLAALNRKLEESQTETQRLGESIEARSGELSASIEERKNELSNEIEAKRAEFAEKLGEFESSLEAERTGFSELRTSQTGAFEEAEQRRADDAAERIKSAQEQLDGLVAKAEAEVEARVAEIRRMEEESSQLVGAIGLAGTAERYGEEVDEQKRAADLWRRVTVVLAVLAVAGVIVAVSERHPVAETFAGKLALSVILGGIATYAARQSGYHRRREQRARDLQLELTAFSPFIEPLSAEQQEEERVIMTRKTFGKTTQSTAPEEEPGPTPLSFLLQRKEKEASIEH